MKWSKIVDCIANVLRDSNRGQAQLRRVELPQEVDSQFDVGKEVAPLGHNQRIRRSTSANKLEVGE
jgi:hypothetical protein